MSEVHWNYRIVIDKNGMYSIRKVYYNEDNSIYANSENPEPVIGESLEDLKLGFEYMKMAFDKPCLIEENIVYKDR
jgi:hypothetical protein